MASSKATMKSPQSVKQKVKKKLKKAVQQNGLNSIANTKELDERGLGPYNLVPSTPVSLPPKIQHKLLAATVR
jgi:hypothetical protein